MSFTWIAQFIAFFVSVMVYLKQHNSILRFYKQLPISRVLTNTWFYLADVGKIEFCIIWKAEYFFCLFEMEIT